MKNFIDAIVGDGTHFHMPDRSILALEPGDLVRMQKRILLPEGGHKWIVVEREVSAVTGHHTTFKDGYAFGHDSRRPEDTVEVFRPRAKMRNGWRSESDEQIGTSHIDFLIADDKSKSKPARQDSRKPRTSDGVKRAVTTHKIGATKS